MRKREEEITLHIKTHGGHGITDNPQCEVGFCDVELLRRGSWSLAILAFVLCPLILATFGLGFAPTCWGFLHLRRRWWPFLVTYWSQKSQIWKPWSLLIIIDLVREKLNRNFLALLKFGIISKIQKRLKKI